MTQPRFRRASHWLRNPERLVVMKCSCDAWEVRRDGTILASYPTHAEAIAYADAEARKETK